MSDGSYRVRWRFQNEDLTHYSDASTNLQFQKWVTVHIGFGGGFRMKILPNIHGSPTNPEEKGQSNNQPRKKKWTKRECQEQHSEWRSQECIMLQHSHGREPPRSGPCFLIFCMRISGRGQYMKLQKLCPFSYGLHFLHFCAQLCSARNAASDPSIQSHVKPVVVTIF